MKSLLSAQKYLQGDNTEYEANLFAADLILDDKEIADLSKNEDLNYFGLCSLSLIHIYLDVQCFLSHRGHTPHLLKSHLLVDLPLFLRLL